MKAKRTKFSTLRKTAGITAIIAATALISEKTYAHNPIIPENKASLMTAFTNKDNENGAILEAPEMHQPDLAIETPMKNDVEKVVIQPTEIKKESLKTISDTITPKRLTENKEVKNTNINTDDQTEKDIIPAEYPDGKMSLRAKVARNMDTSIINPMNGTITATAYVHINETGKTINVTVSGSDESFNKELLKTVTAISNETTWKPATKDGKPIASILKVPATMTFTRP